MKKLFLSVLLSAAFCGFAAEANPLAKYVPAGIDGALYINAEKVNALPMVKEIPELAKAKSDFEKENKVKFSDLRDFVITGTTRTNDLDGMVVRYKLANPDVLKLLKDEKVELSEKKAGERTIYSFTPQESSVKELNSEVSFTFLEDGVLLAGPSKQFGAYLAALNKGTEKELFSRPFNSGALAELYLKPVLPADLPQELAQSTDGIKSLYASLTASGKEDRDLALDALVVCEDVNAAKRIAMQLKMYVMMGVGFALQDNPDLGEKITNAFKITAKDNQVHVNFSLPETLRKELSAYLEGLSKKNAAEAAPAAK